MQGEVLQRNSQSELEQLAWPLRLGVHGFGMKIYLPP